MGITEAVKERVSETISAELAPSGFSLKKGSLVTQLSSGFTGSIGLNFSLNRTDGLIGLNPIASIVCRQIEDALVDLTEGAERRPLPSLSTALGYLTPENRFLEWLFDPNAPPTGHILESKRIAELIVLYGIPFLREHSSISAIVGCLEESRFSFVERADYHLPVAYRLLGEGQKAEALVKRRLSDFDKRRDIAANQYRRFAGNFLSDVARIKQNT
ncbi:MAG: hypothetical protein ABSD75_32025 [Terriglobales bacterium]|jgi:hypothetical protein